jgi:hypothetical protein
MRNVGVLVMLLVGCGAPSPQDGSESQASDNPPLAQKGHKPDAGSVTTPDAGAKPDASYALCCGTVAVSGQGWAYYWEKDPQATACARASDAADTSCRASDFGLACCDLPKTCASCVDWGTYVYCTNVGYLQIYCQ